MLITKAVDDIWHDTVDTICATFFPEAFGKLGHTWRHGEVTSLRPAPNHTLDMGEHFDDVYVTRVD